MGHVIADIIFVLAALLIVMLSARRGFFRTLMRFAKTFIAIGIAYLCGGMLAPWIAKTFPSIGEGFLSVVISYVAVFVLSLLILTVGTWFLGKLVDRLALVRTLDKLLGALVGVIIAVMLMFVAASIMKSLDAMAEIYPKTLVIKLFGDSSLLDLIGFLNVGNLLK